jgi:hypothetical protein
MHFAAATWESLLGMVANHYRNLNHETIGLDYEVEEAICRRLPSSDHGEFCTAFSDRFSRSNCILLLGRYGDIVNLLPLAYGLSRSKKLVEWIIGKDFADILDGVSYVSPIVVDDGPDSLRSQIATFSPKNPRVAQCWKNPNPSRKTESFCLESWRLASALDEFGKWPLVFDKRDEEREDRLVDAMYDTLPFRSKQWPLVLVAGDSVSSPFTRKKELLDLLRRFCDAAVVDLSEIKAEKPYDLLALIERADCLVSVDTLHLHLARACYTPVVALTSKGWLGSVPPPQTVAQFNYSGADLITNVVEAVKNVIEYPVFDYTVTANPHGEEQRHKDAQATWGNTYLPKVLPRSSKQIGDRRDLPYVKDVLKSCMAISPTDVIILTNTDVHFPEGSISKIMEHARKFKFGCSRRHSSHLGREVYWFERRWLRDHIDEMPDAILGAPKVDFIIAKWMRQYHGIQSTLETLAYDFPPVELPPGLIYHPPHMSAWLSFPNAASARHNQNLWETT